VENNAEYRVRGIDACSNEIGCRPEIFAPEFRYLLGTLPSLNLTFHVGEEFLDIVDGLRAIDEVIEYIVLPARKERPGTANARKYRLGHALAAGISAKDYYERKHATLVMPNQELLDNLVWMLRCAEIEKIFVSSKLKNFLEKKICEISTQMFEEEVSRETLFRAWQMRGNHPQSLLTKEFFELYSSGKNEKQAMVNFYKELSFCRGYHINPTVPAEAYCPEAKNVFERYSFCQNVREKGKEMTMFELKGVACDYRDLVNELQKFMITKIKKLDIMVESNPSSNVLIGSLLRYEKHPIFRFSEVDNISENDICTSINTDDLGVFGTSIQNEYVLLETAMRKSKRFTEDQIKKYLKKVNNHGKAQVFR